MNMSAVNLLPYYPGTGTPMTYAHSPFRSSIAGGIARVDQVSTVHHQKPFPISYRPDLFRSTYPAELANQPEVPMYAGRLLDIYF